MITREQAIQIAEDYFNGDFKVNYCEHHFEYSKSEKRWYGELSKTNNIPTLKQLMFIEDIEDETGETFRGFTKEAATKFISDYVDNRESYDDYMGDCLNY